MKKIDYKDYLIGIIILLYAFQLYGLMSDFKQLPGPLLGGDVYYQLGAVQHIKEGGAVFKGTNILESGPGYLPLYPLLVATFGSITGMDGMHSMLFFALILFILSALCFYLLLNELFGNKLFSVFLIALYYPISLGFILKYTAFTQLIMMPLLFFTLYRTVSQKSFVWAGISGVVYGLIGFSHAVAFIGATLFLAVLASYFLLFQFLDWKNKKIVFQKSDLKLFAKLFGLVFIIGVIIAQLYWFNPIFVHNLETPKEYLSWNNEDFSNTKYQFIFLRDIAKTYFFNFSSLISGLISVLALLGLASLIVFKKQSLRMKYMLLIIVTSVIALLHYFITQPILGTNFYPVRMNDFLFFFAVLIIIGLAGSMLMSAVRNKKWLTIGLIVLIAATLFFQ